MLTRPQPWRQIAPLQTLEAEVPVPMRVVLGDAGVAVQLSADQLVLVDGTGVVRNERGTVLFRLESALAPHHGSPR